MQKKVAEIFNCNVFSIPNYQRDYAWNAKNLDDLWEDLLEAEKVKSDEMGHFLGTIVVAKNPNSPQIYDIIDGQQRATTLFMLRYALNFKTKDPNRNLNNFLDDNDNFRLQVTADNQSIFKKILEQSQKDGLNSNLEQELKEYGTDGQKRLYEVFKEIWSYIADLPNERAKELLNVLDKMVVMWLEEKDSGRAIRMFQTVNDRGMPLLLLDKLKALLILYSNKHCGGKLDNIINERFGSIFKIIARMRNQKVISSLGDKDFEKYLETRIFNYHALGQKDIGDYKYGANESYKKIKDLLKTKIKDYISPQDLQKWLDDYSKDLLGFFEAFLSIMEKAMKNKELFKLLFILKINTYFYASLVRLEMNGCLDNENIILLAQAEILFYGFGSSNDASAYKLSQFATNKNEFKVNLKTLCNAKSVAKGGYKNFNEAFNEIAYENYDWGKYFHYLFFNYRCQKMDIGSFVNLLGDKTYSYSIEHIVSQNVIDNGSLEQYAFKNEDEFVNLRDSFGNLLVLEQNLNSSNSDAGLAKKQENYKKSKIFYNKEFANREDFLSFNKENIVSENQKFTQWAKEFFKDFL